MHTIIMKRMAGLLLCALLLCSIPMTGYAAQVKTEEPVQPVSEQRTVALQLAPDQELPDNGELFAQFVEQKLYGYEMATFGTAAREKLNTAEQEIYDKLKEKIEAVAVSGGSTSFVLPDLKNLKTQWTNTELGVASLEDNGVVDGAFFSQLNLDDVVFALLSDCPLDLYWFDKSAEDAILVGYHIGWSGYYDEQQNVIIDSAEILDFTLIFGVSADYAAGDNTVTTDVAKITTARNTAAQVVSNNASKSDYEKLVAYKTYICDATSYNFDAVEDKTTLYGDPWQLIWVFDGDDSTEVVCEGYSKAFMYLCDLSTFGGDTACYTVTGQMDGGNHMWNTVTIDGHNYLVDVTNSEEGTVGQDGSLFMVGASGSVTGGYTVCDTFYAYDNQSIAYWGTGADSILTLSADDYDPNAEEESIIASGACGKNLTWILDEEGTLTISGTGEMYAFSNASNYSWHNYRSAIQKVLIESGATSIGYSAFADCTNLESVTIPEGVVSIGGRAFSGCELPTELVLPSSLTSIGTRAFMNWKGLTELTVPDSVTQIGSEAFYGCINLTEVTLPFVGYKKDTSGVAKLPLGYVFGTSQSAGTAVSQKYKDASDTFVTGTFYLPSGLKSVTITGGEIHPGAFENCSQLTSITLPQGIKEIGINALHNCSGITEIKIPATVETIRSGAFQGCSGLTGIELPETVTGIGNYAFQGCSGLTGVELPETVTSIGQYAFQGCSSATSINIPSGITEISFSTFEGCKSLESVTIPEDVVSIMNRAFSGCTSMNHIVFAGKAPTFGTTYVFRNVVADAYYPDKDDTWTSDVMQDYGGKITWIPYGGQMSVLGDLNLDGAVDSDDLTLLARHVGGIEPVEDAQALANCDVNGDGQINSDDLTRHARYVGGIITDWDDE